MDYKYVIEIEVYNEGSGYSYTGTIETGNGPVWDLADFESEYAEWLKPGQYGVVVGRWYEPDADLVYDEPVEEAHLAIEPDEPTPIRDAHGEPVHVGDWLWDSYGCFEIVRIDNEDREPVEVREVIFDDEDPERHELSETRFWLNRKDVKRMSR